MVLEVTRAARYVPGTNLRSVATGASWLYALPTLDLSCVVCLGTPGSATLTGLAGRAGRVVVVEPDTRERRRATAWVGRHAADGRVEVAATAAGVPDGAAALVVLGRAAARRVAVDGGRGAGRPDGPVAQLRRLLAPGGLVHADLGIGPAPHGLEAALAGITGGVRRAWVTPSRGEVRTAAPDGDDAATTFLLEQGMSGRSVDLADLKRTLRRRLTERAEGAGPLSAEPTITPVLTTAVTAAPSPPRPPGGRRLGALRGPAQRSLEGAQRLVDRAERVVVGSGPLGRLGRRHTLVGAPADVLGDGPPRYLVDVAAASGVDVRGMRWGLAAPGEYGSRKVLVLLFGPGPDAPLECVVKLTRDPVLNPRLDNEFAGLRLLAEREVANVPRAVFHGRHAGLTLLGQSAMDGRAFDAVTSRAADCPRLLDAVDWVTALGTRTVARGTAPDAVRDAAVDLTERFCTLYGSDAAERTALLGHAEALGAQPVPVVVQHGDLGTWNLRVDAAGRTVVLDWEAIEPAGLPLLDLFYLVRTFALLSAGPGRDHDRGFRRDLLEPGPLHTALAGTTRRYCEAVGVPAAAVEPLFALTWVHRAVKEATRLRPGRLQHGQYVNALRATLARPEAVRALAGRTVSAG
ncbi:phosphotransferase [Kineosporia sp. R_H_3]|uniref:phosphotransferase n=1 Tax=Kineosporia sp. R_H_3 TaxID=1961848 RepID=UPI000B4BCEC0|nr:phosphotransferase [Kineosporia sp. R_H_3]